VPDRFRAVQWTRLRGGEVAPEVRTRLLKLWSHRSGALKNEETKTTAPNETPASAPAGEAIGKSRTSISAFIAAGALAIVALTGWWLFGGKNKTAAAAVAPRATAKSGPASAPLSEARQLANNA